MSVHSVLPTPLSLERVASVVGGSVLHKERLESSLLTGVASSTREIKAGNLFVAIRGVKEDGHRYVGDAFRLGAGAALVSEASVLHGMPGILVPDTRAALSSAASAFFEDPSKRLHVIGLTGTNGKTTTNWMIYHLLNLLGTPSLRIGTLGMEAEGVISDEGSLTTPDPVSLHRTLKHALDAGVKAAVMEASSHALDQARVSDVKFDVGIFTNLTRDHLDYHATMEAYFEAKKKLFWLIAQGESKVKSAVINSASEHGRLLVAYAKSLKLNLLRFGKTPENEIQIVSFKQSFRGSELIIKFKTDSHSIHSNFIGFHNAENMAGAFGALAALGYDSAEIASALSSVPPVPGRLEPVYGKDFGVFVDYAHTPDALQNVLLALRELVENELWVVFGCGGDRDKGKRPVMGRIAAQFAHRVVVTSDNPRTEKPESIISDILSEGLKPSIVEPDRRKAIQRTLREAKKGDVILIAGKGHENYQILGTEKIHFSDIEEVQGVFRTI